MIAGPKSEAACTLMAFLFLQLIAPKGLGASNLRNPARDKLAIMPVLFSGGVGDSLMGRIMPVLFWGGMGDFLIDKGLGNVMVRG